MGEFRPIFGNGLLPYILGLTISITRHIIYGSNYLFLLRKGPPMTTLAFSYLRFSSKKQEKGDSLRRQTKLFEEKGTEFCKRRGWTLSQKNYKDLGVSAFRGKNALIGNLGEFLKVVEAGTVPQGSALIVESIDRISRQGIDEGYDLVKKILKAGIILVTLSPEREFDVSATKSLSKGALEIQLILERAAEESEMKSKRVGAGWEGRRKKAREGKEVLVAGVLPAWIERTGNKMHLIPERAEVVRKIIHLAAEGYGRSKIVQYLKAEKIPPFTDREDWSSASIAFILSDRRAIGEYQPKSQDPKTTDKRKLIPIGSPILGYYPSAVTEQEYLAARAGMSKRKTKVEQGRRWSEEEDKLVRNLKLSVATVAARTKRTRSAVHQRRSKMGLTEKQDRQGGNFVNVFSGLVRNARPPHDSYVVVQRMDGSGPSKALLNRSNIEGKGRCYIFQLIPFERGILSALKELNPDDVMPKKRKGPNEVKTLEDSLAGIEAELSSAENYMEKNGFSETIGKRISTLEEKKKVLSGELLSAKVREADIAGGAGWKEAGSLLTMLDDSDNSDDIRRRLRSALKRFIDGISLLVVPRGRDRLAVVQINFNGGGKRDYIIHYHPARSNASYRTEGYWQVRSWNDEDFRRAWATGTGQPPTDLLNHIGPVWICEDDEGRDVLVTNWADVEKSLLAADLEALFAGCERHPLP